MTTLYLAGAWHDRPRMRLMRSLICAAGFGVRAGWLDVPEGMASFERGGSRNFYASQAEGCLCEIELSHGLVIFRSEPLSEGASIETGFALALNKPVFLVGRASSIFHAHDLIVECEGLSGLVIALHWRFAPQIIELPNEAWDHNSMTYIAPPEIFAKLKREHSADCDVWTVGRACDCIGAVSRFETAKRKRRERER